MGTRWKLADVRHSRITHHAAQVTWKSKEQNHTHTITRISPRDMGPDAEGITSDCEAAVKAFCMSNVLALLEGHVLHLS